MYFSVQIVELSIATLTRVSANSCVAAMLWTDLSHACLFEICNFSLKFKEKCCSQVKGL